jgi:hypothetical protein
MIYSPYTGTDAVVTTSTSNLYLTASGASKKVYICGGSGGRVELAGPTVTVGDSGANIELAVYGYIDQDGSTYNTFESRIQCASFVEGTNFKLTDNGGHIYFRNGSIYSLYVDASGDLYYDKNGTPVKLN